MQHVPRHSSAEEQDATLFSGMGKNPVGQANAEHLLEGPGGGTQHLSVQSFTPTQPVVEGVAVLPVYVAGHLKVAHVVVGGMTGMQHFS